MKKRIYLILAIFVIADIYFFQLVKTLTANIFIVNGYWVFDLLLIFGLLFFFIARTPGKGPAKAISWVMALVLLSLVPKIFALPVLLLEDITRLFRGFPPRSVWVSELALAIAAIPFLGLLFGLTRGGHYYKVHKETLFFDDLPEGFDGFTITQLSDIHSGSFTSEKGVEKAWRW